MKMRRSLIGWTCSLILVLMMVLMISGCSRDERDTTRYEITGVELLDTFTRNTQKVTVFPEQPVRMYIYDIRLTSPERDTVFRLETRVGNMSDFIGDTVVICGNDLHYHD